MVRSIKTGVMIMVASAIMSCIGQIMWKLSANAAHPLLFWGLGFVLYGMGAVCMIVAYRFGDVSVLQPVLSVGFVISVFLGWYILGETMTIYKVVGTILIILGIIILNRSSKKENVEWFKTLS